MEAASEADPAAEAAAGANDASQPAVTQTGKDASRLAFCGSAGMAVMRVLWPAARKQAAASNLTVRQVGYLSAGCSHGCKTVGLVSSLVRAALSPCPA